MKALSSYSILLVVLTTFSACNKQLDQLPVSSTTSSNFFLNTNDFTQAVTGAYSRLRDYPNQAYWLGETRSDNVLPSSDGNRDWQGINDFSPNLTTTDFVVGAWNSNLSGIFNVNTVLDALATKGDVITDATLRKRFEGELRFLRAFYYFTLVRFYGKVPIVKSALTPEQVANIQRSPVADVYNFIVEDLTFAISNLPPSYTGSDIGRATSVAANGLLGLVYLTKSGPTYGVEGPGLNSNEYDKALTYFNTVLSSSVVGFEPNYPKIFSYTNENNKEVVFDIQFMLTSNGASYPSQLVPGAYWTGIGLSGYDNAYGTASYNVTKDLMQSYRNSAGSGTDTRDTFSIQHSWVTAAPVTTDTTRPFIKKYINIPLRGTGRADWPINFIVMRYTDVMMMKAECILKNPALGTQTDVDNIVNQVRTRANVPAVSNVTYDMLIEERRREFLGEGLRWNDLVRSGKAVTTMNTWAASEGATSVKTVIPQYVIYPIPQAEILAKPGFYIQNDGYY